MTLYYYGIDKEEEEEVILAIMTPHAEEVRNDGTWRKVKDTRHEPNSNSWQEKYCHALVKGLPNQYREVADKFGPVCSHEEHQQLIEDVD